MELRSIRSRSRTPLLKSEYEQKSDFEQHVHSEEVIVQHSYSTRNKNSYKSSSTSDEVFSSSPKVRSEKAVRKTRQKTSDYSSEDGENEISSTKYDSENIRSHTNTYKESTQSRSNGQVKSPLQIYKEAGDYWNKVPKTDYTYSRHSKDRIELAPGVVAMPNMSRRSIHRDCTDSTSYTSQSQSEQYTESADYEKVRYHHNRLEPKALFTDEIDHTFEFTRFTSTVTSTFIKIYIMILSFFNAIYRSNVSALLWIGRGYYRAVSRILLLDTWLLQRTNQRRHLGALIALLFLPLFLLAGWWLCSSVSHALFVPILSTTDDPAKSEITLDHTVPLSSIIIPSQSLTDERVNVEDIVEQILNNPTFESIIIKHLTQKASAAEEQKLVVGSLKNDVNQVKTQLNSLHSKYAKLAVEMNKCCRRQYVHIESHVTKIISDLIGKPGVPLRSEDISEWLHAIFVAKQDLEINLSNITKNMQADMDNLVEISAKKIMDDVSMKISAILQQQLDIDNMSNTNGGISEAQVKRIVKQALAVYDADKTGMVDYALESSGGQILSTRCTESYNARTAVLSVLGIPLWYPSNTPRTVISPGVEPGHCWAFQGFPGFLVIKLTAYIKVSAFSLEHIPKCLAPGGRIDSAPKDFTVFGLKSENDHDPWLLGKYTYDAEGASLQYFAVQNEGHAFNLVELRIDSNNGNMNYTCLYRFRVHGSMSVEPT